MQNRDLYFNPNYAKVYGEIDGKCDTFVFENQYGKIIHTFILREVKWSINGQTYYDIVTPYGYGGPLVERTTDIAQLIATYKIAFEQYCRENNIVCEFIRFHLFENVNVRENYYGDTIHLLDNVVVNTSGDFEENIWMRYEHKVRKNVKKAEKNNLQILIETNLEHLHDFLSIYNSTMDRNNADSYYYFGLKYFEDIASMLPDNYVYFHVLKDGKIISSELVLCSEKYAYSFLGGTLTDYYEFRPNDFLKNEIIKWCNRTGRKQFVLGGGYHKGDGIYRYKRSFTQHPDVPFYVGRHIFDQEKYDQIVALRAAEDPDFNQNTGYFPKYRG